MNAALFLARRYVRASRKEAQVGVVGAAAFFGLAVGVGALVVSLALLAVIGGELADLGLGESDESVLAALAERLDELVDGGQP